MAERRLRRPRKARLAAALAATAALAGCSLVRGPAIPVWHELHAAPNGAATGLVVMLPGIGDDGHAFVQNGMVAQIQQLAPHLDVATVDAHVGYYVRGILAERVHQDVVRPRRDRYQQVWLVGISLGGLGASNYASRYPHVVDGVLLLAPFLGEQDVVDAVAAAGGVRAWVAPEADRFDNPMRQLAHQTWTWARGIAESRQGPGDGVPTVLLGYGRQDRYAGAHAQLAEALPPDAVRTVDGGHDWDAWRALFGPLAARAFASAQPPGTTRVTDAR